MSERLSSEVQRMPRGRAEPPLDFLSAHGELARLIRDKDWSETPLGPIEGWPQSLRTIVSLCLASNFPINIVWGPQHIQIYNDGYRDCCGDAHPRALGENYRLTWASAWPAIGESFERALAGETMYLENQRMFLRRLNGSDLEETFFTFSHSPIRNESGGITGLFHPVTETTASMLAERRNRALRDLSTSLATASDEADAARRAIDVLRGFEFDLPFVLYYALDFPGNYRLAGHFGIEAGTAAAPSRLPGNASQPWPFAEALASLRIVESDRLAALLTGRACGPYQEPPRTVLVLPIVVPSAERPPVVIVAGVSPRLRLTDDYHGFYELLRLTVAGALSTVRAREDERCRAQTLAQIDHAKTLFFSNISHEFRTPLTLLLGPLEDVLASDELPDSERARLDVAYRNSLRLLKLVNSLLDFARVEAGRAEASYAPIDLAEVTRELASNFRSACERAGLRLEVDCPPLPQPVYVDRGMWEKIVLNLLSNAFKFTFEGAIAVRLRATETHAVLSVSDTGAGIPAAELPRLFERFHRIEGQRGRTFEGSGIGLALVQELVGLHGGTIRADSEAGRGTVFTVGVPFGTVHLPHERIGAESQLVSTSVRAEAYVQEALHWLPGGDGEKRDPRAAGSIAPARTTRLPAGRSRPKVLLADDNGDMRDYVRELLQQDCEVRAVGDGAAALAALHEEKPDIVITDVMMPVLDGFGLLHAIRGDPAWRDIPVVMLSARAGEESRVEGLAAGADGYLVKPFSARELIARVTVNLELASARLRDKRKLESRRGILEMVAGGAPLRPTLDALMLTLEAHEPGMRCGILIVTDDGRHFRRGSGPHLPEAYHRAFDGVPIGEPWLGSCCEAADRCAAVKISDISADTRYAPEWRELLLNCGIHASRSTPVCGHDGCVLASIAMYYDRVRDPDPADHEVINMATHLAAIAIEHDAAVAALRDSEEEQKYLLRLSDALRPLVEPEEIQAEACKLLGRQLGVQRAYFVEIDESRGYARVRKEYLRGEAPSAVARYPLSTFAWVTSLYKRGEPVVVADVMKSELVPAAERQSLAVKHIAWIAVPVVKRGELVGALCVAELKPRGWTTRETMLVVETAERIWAAAERGLAEQALREQEQRQALLIHELNHRVKNTLAVVQALAVQTLRGANDMDDARDALDARLISLSRAHDLLTAERWQGGDLATTVRASLETWFGAEKPSRFHLCGEPLRLRPKALLALSMAVHELATNALKYGALSNQTGEIEICWDFSRASGEFRFNWVEYGGPEVKPPERRGFGSRLIERGLAADVSGEVRLAFPVSGLMFTLTAPLKEIEGGSTG